jgi:hypothetical protein
VIREQLWDNVVHRYMRIFRRRRAKELLRLIPHFETCTVCDVGGSRHYWEKVSGILTPQSLVILNIRDDAQSISHDGSKSDDAIVLYDGVTIPYEDEAFDVVICNSVIEHVPTRDRANLVREIRRVGKSFFIQTPAKEFIFEPHFMLPFVHWLPRSVGRRLVKFGGYSILRRPSKDELDQYFDEVRLLNREELHSYAPDASLSTEWVCGLPKSFTLYSVR